MLLGPIIARASIGIVIVLTYGGMPYSGSTVMVQPEPKLWTRKNPFQRFQSRKQRHRRNVHVPEVPTIDNPSFTFLLHPTSAMSTEGGRRELLGLMNRGEHEYTKKNETGFSTVDLTNEWWFAPEQNAVYATIPDRRDPAYANDRALHEFHTHRHLSRYERAYRTSRGINLHVEWNGEYNDDRFLSFLYEEGGLGFDEKTAVNETHNHRRIEQTAKPEPTTETTGGFFNNYQSVPLSQGYGTHFANVWVGTPTPQRKTVIVDTGSHYTAFPCHGCQNCGRQHHTDPYFRPENSNTFHKLQCSECEDRVACDGGDCKFSQAYTEGSSWEAVQVKDQFYCGGTDVLDSVSPSDRKYAIEFMFGCQISMTGLFITQLADGIMGMSAHPATLPKKLYDKRKIEHNMFAMCYRRELGTSKRGVTAGSMTLGGISSNLDTGPFVFARNVAKVGWYTVYVKNIFIRSGGGQSAKSVDHRHHTIKVPVNVKTLNSGKGVIVDSGTTDTYLNKKVAKEFTNAWKRVTGIAYSHLPMSLTLEQLRSLPTILIQCQALSPDIELSMEDYDALPGYAGSLDPSSPSDLLVAIPATSYMDYSPISKQYMSRLYFTESVGGVLGSNTMQGHNVLFDWQNGRIGFAESSCAYDKQDIPPIAEDSGFSTDCEVGEPVLTKACIETVDRRMCRLNPTSIALLGNEQWSVVVDSPGNEVGISCVDIASGIKRTRDNVDDSAYTCSGEGLCEEERPCQLTCAQSNAASEVKPIQAGQGLSELNCADPRWSACDYGCFQTKIESMAYSDGICHEAMRTTRPCHKGACARSDPCRVPFLIHSIFSFRNGSVLTWSRSAEEILSTALENAVGIQMKDQIFTAGDVHVVTALPWYQDSDADDFVVTADKNYSDDYNSLKIGMKVVVEISIFNPLSEIKNMTKLHDEGTDDEIENRLSAVLQNLTNRFRGRKPKVTCSSVDLYTLAHLALKTKELMRHGAFAVSLIEEIKSIGEISERSAFGPIGGASYDVSKHVTTSVWLIRTGVADKINYFGPRKPLSVKVFVVVQNVVLLCFLFFSMMVIWSCLLSAYDVWMDRSRQDKRRNRFMVSFSRSIGLPYALEVQTDDSNNPDDVEDTLLRGTSGNVGGSNGKTLYKLTEPKKRFRMRSPNSNSMNGQSITCR